MSRQVTLRGAVNRVVIAALAITAAILLAPGATATPESDASDAISAAWDAGGGTDGPLGPKQGDLYPVGAGFAQNFTGGKIFFSPATGAHAMQGAILDKYESLGGAADGDMGFPTIDEGPGRAPDSRNTTFSASDNPVIFWTPGTGARVVRGPINAAWDKLGGSSGPLGVPSDDETYRGHVVSQAFTGGELSYNTKDRTFSTVPPDLAGQLADLTIPDDPTAAINTARRAAGGPLGPLGAAQGAPYQIGKDGLAQNFDGGKIFYTPETGANVVTGQVLTKYESVGGPEGDLGFPTSSEVDGGLATASRMSSFAAKDSPIIFWTPDYGAVIVRGAMSAAWDRLGGAKGALGAPMADQTENGDIISQRFSGGVVSWDSKKKSFTTEPADLATQLAGVEVPGQDVPQAQGNAPTASDTNARKWFHWSWWWLLAIVPVLVLVGLVAFATMRRRGGGDDPFDNDEDGTDGDAARMYRPAGTPEVATSDDDYSAAMFGDRYSSERPGSLPSTPTEYSPPQNNPWAARSSDDDEPPTPIDEDEDPDAVDTAPTRVPTDIRRDPLTDTGRHARIDAEALEPDLQDEPEVDEEPEPARTAFRLPLDDPDEVPDGYPVKADTRSGMYWVPGNELYEDVRAEIWFASEEFARANGFVRDE